MKVLFATDGSEQAEMAGRLIAVMHWPADTVIRVVTAIDVGSVFFGAPLAPAVPANADALEQQLINEAERVLEAAARDIAATGAVIERSLVRQRPASGIVDEATDWRPDLIVLGSCGHGQIASMMVGSVSAEVVDHAPCPVLVARRPTLGRAILAHDGSEFAQRGEAILAEWPIFQGVAVEVVSVGPGAAPWAAGLAPTMYAGGMDVYRESMEATLTADAELVEASARRLRQAGRRVTTAVVEGDPVTQLIAVAVQRQADVIVIGTRGRTGLRRLLLGSVARNVMHHASCSVLIVR